MKPSKENNSKKVSAKSKGGESSTAAAGLPREHLTSTTLVPQVPWSTRARQHLGQYFHHYLIFVMLWLFGSVIMYLCPSFRQQFFAAEIIRNGVVKTEFDFRFLSHIQTQEAMELAVKHQPSVYVTDDIQRNVDAVERHFLQMLADNPQMPQAEQLSQQGTRQLLRDTVANYSTRGIVSQDNKILDRPNQFIWANGDKQSLVDFQDFPTPEEAEAGILQDFQTAMHLLPETMDILRPALKGTLEPTIIYNSALTEKKKKETREEAVSKVKARNIPKGEQLISVTYPYGKDSLQEYQKQLNEISLWERMKTHHPSWAFLMRVTVFGLFLLALGAGIIKFFSKRVPELSALRTTATALAIHFLLLFLVTRYTSRYQTGSLELAVLLVCLPLSLAPALVSNLIGTSTAFLTTIFIAMTAPLFLKLGYYDFQIIHFTLFAGIISAIVFRNVRKRMDFVVAGFALGLVVLLSCCLFICEQADMYRLLQEHNALDILLEVLTFSYINGFGVAILCFILLPVFEWMFGLVTPTTLMELSDGSHPLLLRLQKEAPGTYQHSLNVSTIAQEAAEAVGADAQLTKVMALFHDIGKLDNPQCFAENLPLGTANPHDSLSPEESVNIIRRHTVEGEALGLKYHVKRPIRPVMLQHHGNSLIGNFLQKARKIAQEQGLPEPKEEDFRYQCEPPSQKEIVIISLADACEAAVKSLFMKKPDLDKIAKEAVKAVQQGQKDGIADQATLEQTCAEAMANSLPKLTKDDIKGLISSIFDGKLQDGQLDNSTLTVQELKIIRESFYKTFTDMYHFRPQYVKTGPQNEN